MSSPVVTNSTKERRGAEDSQPPSLKRRRIPLACNGCRTRKSRCDGDQPSCGTCKETGNQCVYLRAPYPRVNDDNSEFLELRSRLQALEELVASSKSGQTQLGNVGSAIRPPSVQEWAPSVVNGPAPLGVAESTTDASPSLVSVDAPVDGMGAILLETEEVLTFFGPSSNISFTRHITQTVARLNHISNPWGSSFNPAGMPFLNIADSPPDLQHLQNPQKPQEANALDRFALPTEGMIENLIDHYFSDVGLLFPNLHKPTFMECYAQMKRDGPMNTRRIWLGILNMVFAVGALTIMRNDSMPQNRSIEARKYYERAVSLCEPIVLSGTSLEVVQYLLLMTHYLQATRTSVQTSNTLGMAITTAFRIGLHSRQASLTFPRLEREMRNRTWFVCIILDRTLSMTLGRPAAIPYNYVKADLPTDIDTIDQRLAEESTTYSLGVFNATIKLYQIMWKVIDQQYGQNLGFDVPPGVVDVISPLSSIDGELRDWDRSLPLWLKTITSKELPDLMSTYDPLAPSGKAKRFQVVLTLRSLNLTILLHRPVLVKYFEISSTPVSDMTETTLLGRLGRNSIDVCLKSSTEIILIVHRLVHNSGPARRLLNVWWYTLYYTFNAALVLSGIILILQDSNHKIADPPSEAECRGGLVKAISALALLDQGNQNVERCHNYLKRLMSAIDTLTSKSSDFPVADLRSSSAYGNAPNRILSAPNSAPVQSPINGYNLSGRNVGDLMTGDDLSFLNFYFAPTPEAPPDGISW